MVPGGAGSGTDLIARALAEAANATGMQPPMRVRNIDGDDGVDGAAAVMNAPGDGCMMLLTHQGLLANFLTWKAPFSWQEFRHVALLTRTPMVLAAPVSAPFDDARTLLDAAREGAVTVSMGPGTVGEFAMRALGQATGVEFRYDAMDGARDRVLSLLAEEVQMTPVTTALAKRLRETLKVKLIAVTDRDPSALVPDVDTLRDQRVPFDYAIDLGVLLPASAPPELAAGLSDSLERAVNSQAFKGLMHDYDVRVDFRPLTQYTIYWENLTASWRELATDAGYDRASR